MHPLGTDVVAAFRSRLPLDTRDHALYLQRWPPATHADASGPPIHSFSASLQAYTRHPPTTDACPTWLCRPEAVRLRTRTTQPQLQIGAQLPTFHVTTHSFTHAAFDTSFLTPDL